MDVLDIIDLAPPVVAKVVSEQAAALKNPPRTAGDLLDTSGVSASCDLAKLPELC